MQSELTPEKRTELRAKAEAATPGSREVAGCEAHRGNLNSNCRRVRLMDGSIVGPREEDMQHLAAFDRETCLALLDAAEERDRLRAEVEQSRFMRDLLTLLADNDATDELCVQHYKGKLNFYINCNDLFWWATADAEEVTPANIQTLRQAFADARAASKYGHIWAGELFAARSRGMRPQNAAYPKDDPEMWPLFDAAGPEREPDKKPFGNPHQHPTKRPPIPSRVSLEQRIAELEAERDRLRAAVVRDAAELLGGSD